MKQALETIILTLVAGGFFLGLVQGIPHDDETFTLQHRRSLAVAGLSVIAGIVILGTFW